MDAERLWRLCNGPRPVVMAIVNATPDSFWAGSRLGTERDAIAVRVEKALEEGAQILDVGGCSTRPGAAEVPAEEELFRVSTALDVIRSRFPQAAVSLDTYRAGVAGAIIARFGPCIVNDISAGEADPGMVPLVAAAGVPYVAMHMRGTPADMASQTDYENVVDEVEAYFKSKIASLGAVGVHRVVLDPGFGFAKTVEQNYALLRELPRLTGLGLPVLAGLSRKSMIWKVTGCGPEEALAGTCALNWEALRQGARILRAHDVREAVDIVKLFEFYNDTGN